MDILFTVENYYPVVGGAERVVQKIAESLSYRGHQVTVATSYVPERKFKEHNGVKVISFRIKGNKVKSISGEIDKYKYFLLNSNFDLICNYAAQTWTTDLTLEILEDIKAKKVLFPCGYSGLALWSKKLFYWSYFRKLPGYLKKYDHIIYHSENYIDKIFGDRHNINHYSIIPIGIDIKEMQTSAVNFRESYNIQTKYLLLNVGNHFKLKGHGFVLEAFRRLNRDDVTLLIIGNEIPGIKGCFRSCKRIASKNPRILLLNNIPREHVVSAFRGSDIFIFGSKVEYFPLVILEAMSVGLPFIATNVGAIREFFGGIVVNSLREMVENINKLLNDGSYHKKLSIEGQKECLSKYTWDKIIPQYEELFNNLIRR